MSSITLTEAKGQRRKNITLEDSEREGIKRLIDAVCFRAGLEDDSVGLVCEGGRNETWCRKVADGIEDFLKLGDDSSIKVNAGTIKIIKEISNAIKSYGNASRKSVKRSHFSELLESLRCVDDLWDLCSDFAKLGGHNLNLPEMRKLVAWLRVCRGGFVLRGTTDY